MKYVITLDEDEIPENCSECGFSNHCGECLADGGRCDYESKIRPSSCPIKNLSDVEEYNKDKAEDKRMEICQIKEKRGWLCVYLNFYTPEVNKIINTAEKEASQTCELCGSKKDVGMTCEGWITTECHDCMKKCCQKNEKPHRWKRNSDGKIYWVQPDKDDELFEGTEL